MPAWMRMVLTVAVAVMPGGFLFLFGWTVWRTVSARWQRARQEGAAVTTVPGALRLLGQIEVRELVREARQFSGIPAAGGGRP